MTPIHARRARRLLAVPFVLAAVACNADAPVTQPDVDPSLARAGYDTPGAHLQYGTPTRLGDGRVRTYVVVDSKAGQPLEIGVALDATAMEGLPDEMVMLHLPFPQAAPAPYTFAMVDWNPMGHEPPGIYDLQHFDFHFYTVPESEVTSITPADPDYAAKANDLPTGDAVPPHYTVLAPPGLTPADVAVPGMGVHWSDVRSPELQAVLGNPGGFAPFTKTFIYGSWDGRMTFLEPMITRAYLLGRPDEVVPIPVPATYPVPGWYPDAYRITYDAQAKEYRIALVGLSRSE